jgi:hypothetical protein
MRDGSIWCHSVTTCRQTSDEKFFFEVRTTQVRLEKQNDKYVLRIAG